MTFTENSSVVTNDTQGPQKYPHHRKYLQGRRSMRENGTKTIPVFLHADGEASWSLLPSLVSLLSGGTVQPENIYSRILKVKGQVWENHKRISITLITVTASAHLPKPDSTNLTIKPDSVLTNPIGKDGARSWSM